MEKDEETREDEHEQQNVEEEDDSEEEQEDNEDSDEQEDDDDESSNLKKQLAIQGRILKKEGFVKDESGKWVKEEETQKQESDDSEDLFSPKDYAYLYSKIHEDDVDEVARAAKVLGITDPKQLLKDSTVKTILERRDEERKTEKATNVGSKRPSSKQIDASEIASRASQGEIPEPGSKEAEELFWERRGGRPQK